MRLARRRLAGGDNPLILRVIDLRPEKRSAAPSLAPRNPPTIQDH